jgi:hypothetical protein
LRQRIDILQVDDSPDLGFAGLHGDTVGFHNDAFGRLSDLQVDNFGDCGVDVKFHGIDNSLAEAGGVDGER